MRGGLLPERMYGENNSINQWVFFTGYGIIFTASKIKSKGIVEQGGKLSKMSAEKKWCQRIALAVALLMLALLMTPLNIWEANATSKNTLQNPRVENGTITWDYVWFGNYPQSSNGNGGFNKEPIKWRVLFVDGKEALLLADQILDGGIPYHTENENVTWETCTMRSWLNGTGGASGSFMDTAFNDAEQAAILKKPIENEKNTFTGIDAGNDTEDQVFLLSREEIMKPSYGFQNKETADRARYATNTAYAASKPEMAGEGEEDYYWLRSPGDGQGTAAYVSTRGYVLYTSPVGAVDNEDVGVRPALYLNLESNCWSYAAPVESANPSTPAKPAQKLNQTISANNITKTYGNKPFNLNAKAKTKLSYASGGKNVATVSKTGRVTLKGPGRAVITITAEATDRYNAASRKITITVKPKRTTLRKVSSTKKRTLKMQWKRDAKATGYQIVTARNKTFKKGKRSVLIRKNKTVSKTLKNLKSKKRYYCKIRAYKQVGKTKIYGAYSKTKQIRVK